MNKVLHLANSLRSAGIDADVDQYTTSPPEGWPAWCKRQIEEADFVLLVCTDAYQRRFDNNAEVGAGLGTCWEVPIIRQLLYDAGSSSRRFVPVLFKEASAEYIPIAARGFSSFVLDSETGFEGLLRFLLNQPHVRKPTLGSESVLERQGDVRSRAVTMGRIADTLHGRGDLDEALRILMEEVLPAFDRLGDVRSRAVTMGRIADILQARGQLNEALRIRREEQLPVFERLGDVRWRALTMGRIADILQARGRLDEALRIRREEQLPVYDRLGDVRSLLVGRANLALSLLGRNSDSDRAEAGGLLCLALADARRMQLPEAEQIEQILGAHGLSCD